MQDTIKLRGVRVHNLQGIDVNIPTNSLTVITGPSGSGKSSLAFDTIYAEGRRRFVQSLSSYARQFLERVERPEADLIESIFPAIAIQQKNQISGSRSSVGTITEAWDYLRLLFARVGVVRDPETGELVRNHSVVDVVEAAGKIPVGETIWICFHPDLPTKVDVLLAKGFIRGLMPGKVEKVIRLEEQKKQIQPKVAIVVDRLKATKDQRNRISEAAEQAFLEGGGKLVLIAEGKRQTFDTAFRSSSGKEFIKPEPNLFSFNNAYGACPRCRGFGDVMDLNWNAVFPDPTRTLEEGAIEPYRPTTRRRERDRLMQFCEDNAIPPDFPWGELTEKHQEMIREGKGTYKGIRGFFARLEKKKYKMPVRVLLSRYRGYLTCPECKGSRLRREAGYVRIGKKTIGDVAHTNISKVLLWLKELKLTDYQNQVVKRVREELQSRLQLLHDLGVGYLTLNRRAQTLSGGEVQRINLATALGGSLIGTIFVLDEPTIGLHERDTDRLVKILKSIRDLGNTVIVVEHDLRVMQEADYIIDLGPGSGREGGKVMFAGNYEDFVNSKLSLTAKYIRGEREIEISEIRRKSTRLIKLFGAREHNLKGINVEFPLNSLCCVTGVSGSGKSTLIHDVLYANIMSQRGAWKKRIGECDDLRGLEQILNVEMVDQSPIGRSSRSNPVTYMKAFSEIRTLFADRFQARTRGYTPSHFSFNAKGGRCETCMGTGEIAIEMQFLPDVHIVCEDCRGTRFKKEILDIKFKDLNIAQVLELSVDEAVEIFRKFPRLIRKLKVLQEVGLGYLQLGQSAMTLSGGEGQRVKLAFHLSKTDISGSLFIFDEPTTGLHVSDVKKLLQAFRRLVFHGASVLVIEHNLDIIKNADWIIDLGPEGGDKGGWIVATGTPEELATRDGSVTGQYLKTVLEISDD
jgi:excinuclease ABC subunit A